MRLLLWAWRRSAAAQGSCSAGPVHKDMRTLLQEGPRDA